MMTQQVSPQYCDDQYWLSNMGILPCNCNSIQHYGEEHHDHTIDELENYYEQFVTTIPYYGVCSQQTEDDVECDRNTFHTHGKLQDYPQQEGSMYNFNPVLLNDKRDRDENDHYKNHYIHQALIDYHLLSPESLIEEMWRCRHENNDKSKFDLRQSNYNNTQELQQHHMHDDFDVLVSTEGELSWAENSKRVTVDPELRKNSKLIRDKNDHTKERTTDHQHQMQLKLQDREADVSRRNHINSTKENEQGNITKKKIDILNARELQKSLDRAKALEIKNEKNRLAVAAETDRLNLQAVETARAKAQALATKHEKNRLATEKHKHRLNLQAKSEMETAPNPKKVRYKDQNVLPQGKQATHYTPPAPNLLSRGKQATHYTPPAPNLLSRGKQATHYTPPAPNLQSSFKLRGHRIHDTFYPFKT